MNRAPEGLFGAVVAEVGVHDLLKVRLPLHFLYNAFSALLIVRRFYYWTRMDF
jgi:hypothetical protein